MDNLCEVWPTFPVLCKTRLGTRSAGRQQAAGYESYKTNLSALDPSLLKQDLHRLVRTDR